MKEVWKICVGSGILPNEEPCHKKPPFHVVVENKDTLPYNGIRNWRCAECFNLHREKVRQKNNK